MASLGHVSPARRSANSASSRRPGGSRKQIPIREYYIPASASVQELKQPHIRTREGEHKPFASSRREDASQEHIHPQQNSQTSIHRSTQVRHVSQSTSTLPARTTSVARRIVLRGPDSAAGHSALQPDPRQGPSNVLQDVPRTTKQKAIRREAQSPSVYQEAEPHTFRYEQDKPLRRSQGTETRQQTFRARVQEKPTRQEHVQSASDNLEIYTRHQTHLPTPSTASTDDLDSEFILQFARDHHLEIGAEVAQSLARAARRRTLSRSPLLQEPQLKSTTADEVKQSSSSAPPQKSPLLSPHPPPPPESSPQPSPTQSIKPPRPPRSSRRLSASPQVTTPVAPETLSNTSHPPREPAKKADTADFAYSSVFDDADEEEDPMPVSPAPLKAHRSYSRRSSMSSTRPNGSMRDRSLSTGSSHIPKGVHYNTPITPHTPATPQIPFEHARSVASPAQLTTTPQQPASPALPPQDESPSEARILISQFDDHTREDYERNRWLSSLLKGLGIQTRATSPELEAHYESDNEEHEDQSMFHAIASNSDLFDMYSETEDDEDDSVVLTGDSFETAPEEGTAIWTGDHLTTRRTSRTSRDSMCYETQSMEGSEGDEEGQSDAEDDGEMTEHDGEIHQEDSDEKSWYADDSRSKYNLRRSYGDKPQPLPPEYTVDEVRKSIIEQRASLGITDSVLAGILATDSFCMPDGVRLSIQEIAARLGTELQRRSSENFSRSRRTTSGHTLSSLPYAGRERYLSVASETSGHSPKFWLKERIPSFLSENTIEIVQEPDGGYDEDDLPPLPSLDSQEVQSTVQTNNNPSKQKPSDSSVRNSALSLSEALALRPFPLELPSEDEAAKAVETLPVRKRTRSVSAFQRLSSTFTGSSGKSKTRKRLPSFLSGLGGSSKNTSSTATSATPPASSNPVVTLTPSAELAKGKSSEQPPNHKRASTGPPRLVDIANEVINAPSSPSVPTQIGRPASPVESTRSKIMGQLPGSTDTWRSCMPDHLYATLARANSKIELRRQEVIYELYRTEESFVNGLKGVVRVFSQPLRTSQGRWIAGVPTPIARLLDWLDDIVYLHSQVISVLADLRHAQGHLVYRVADQLMDFIPRLEVHQPYLIRFESVTRSIDEMLIRPDSDFGEFVRLQQALPECGAMPLSSFLLKPVQRLMKYPLFFKQLRDLTPAHHPDYEETKELLEVTDTMIRTMESVKVREEEYESLKNVATKIVGLPTGLLLAKRDRRLLGQGVVHRVELNDTERHVIDFLEEEAEAGHINASSHPMARGSGVNSNMSRSRSIIPNSAFGASPRPTSYFSDAASLAPSQPTTYSGSSTSYDSNSTALSPPSSTSLSSYSRTTSPSLQALGGVRLPNASTSSLRPDAIFSSPALPFSHKAGESSHSRQKPMSPLAAPATSLRGILKSTSSMALSRTSNNKGTGNTREAALQLFVFNDLVLFTSTASSSTNAVSSGMRGGLGLKPSKSSLKSHASSHTLHAAAQKDDGTRYTVVDDWGVAKLIGVTEFSGKTEHENLFRLDLLPLWHDMDEQRPFSPRSAALCTTVFITLPNNVARSPSSLSMHRRTPSSSTLQRDASGRSSEQASLLEALDRCYVHALKEISFSAKSDIEESKTYPRSGTMSAKSGKRTNLTVKTSSQPNSPSMPRSPSQQHFKPTVTSESHSHDLLIDQEAPRTPAGWQDLNSPTFNAAAHRPDDIAEREERQFWSYRFKKVKNEIREVESFIDVIMSSGLLHSPIEQIEAIISNLNNSNTAGESSNGSAGLMPQALVIALREIKGKERKLRHIMREAKKGVRMISATANTSSSSSVGLAISYSRNGEDTSLDEDDRQYHLQQQRRHRLSEDPRLYSEDDEDAETFEDSRYTDNGNQTHNIERLDRRYDYRNGDEEISGSEYETEDQDGTDYDSQSDHYEEEERVVYPLQKSRARSSNSKHAHQPVPLSPRMQQHIVVQPVSAKPVIAKASSRAPLMSASMQRTTSSDNSNASTAQQNRYGAYYRPSAGMTSSPAMSVSTPKMHSSPSLVPATSSSLAKSSSSTYRSSPVLNSPRLPALSSSSLSSSSPKPTFSTPSTPSNHLSLASQMRRERQASSNALHTSNLESQSPNLNAVRREQIQKRRSKERVRADQRYQIQKRQQREEDYSPPSIQQQRQNESLKNSESMETVYVVQRAQRVPVVRRV